MPHALETSNLALARASDEHRILRICWETNGHMNPDYLDRAMQLSLETGGNVKFDLKFWNEGLALGICGISNTQALRNFERVGRRYFETRVAVPVLSASTLLVPGYVNEDEVGSIAELISSINEWIPYSLLAFHPQYVMSDLPVTSKDEALRCRNAALKYLKRVRIGNEHLLA
jgi:pyruvate formate lyase activating enzyme